MKKTIFRTLQTEVRKPDDEESRRVTFVASTPKRDAAGTVLNQDGWSLDRFNANGVIGYQHKVYGSTFGSKDDPDNVIGKGRAYLQDGRLMVEVEFEPKEINSLAEKIYRKILFGSLRAVSVGFLPVGKGAWGKGEEAVGKPNETYYYAGQELLEVSVVNIPSNPEALLRDVEAMEEELAALRAEADADPADPEDTARPEEDADARAAEDKAEADAREAEKSIRIAEAALRLNN